MTRFLMALAVLASACDPRWSVSRSQLLRDPPPPSCIARALESYASISEVDPRPLNDGRSYRFRSNLGWGYVQLEKSASGHFELRASFSESGFSVPPDIDEEGPIYLDELLSYIRTRCAPAA